MNLKALTTNVMLAESKRLLTEPEVRTPLAGHPLGAALLAEVDKAHVRLARQAEKRRQRLLNLARITERIGVASGRHDSKARALHASLESAAVGTEDPVLAQQYLALQQLLFPIGPAIFARSYTDQAGAIEALEQTVTDEHLALLATILIGKESLADWYRVWVIAGNELGTLVAERRVMIRRATRGGTAAIDMDLRAARGQWINTVQALLSALELMELPPATLESILSSLVASVAAALRNRAPGTPDDAPPAEDELPPIEDELPEDELPPIDGELPPIDGEPSPANDELPAKDEPAVEPGSDAVA
jgi:hypothetical protein